MVLPQDIQVQNVQLVGRRALVTGSSRGIGRAVAISLGHCGADVIVNYVTNKAAAAEVVDALHAMGRQAWAVRADVSQAEELRGLFRRAAEEWGGLDLFVSNAIDVSAFGPVLRMTEESWRHTIDSHATTFLVGAQEACKLMTSGTGAIVAVSSLGGRICFPNYAAVGVGKAAIETLTRYLAVELGQLGISVNAVSAGPIDTDALRLLPQHDEVVELSRSRLPARRMGTPSDVAQIVTFLCSTAARWIVGQTIVADGGLSVLPGLYSKGNSP